MTTHSTYRPFPGYFVAAAVMEVMMVLATVWLLRDPDVLTTKGFLLLALLGFGQAFAISVALRVWQTAWRFTVTQTHLIVEHVYRDERYEIPWTAIERVAAESRVLGVASELAVAEALLPVGLLGDLVANALPLSLADLTPSLQTAAELSKYLPYAPGQFLPAGGRVSLGRRK